MKRFTPEAIRSRMVERLRMSEDWAYILQEGTIGNLIDTISEGNAELARYEEYLLGEKKWKTAMNFSSLQSQSDLIGYKRKLPQSAIGYIIVSHSDNDNKNRLANYGNYFFDIDAPSDYDEIEKVKTDDIEKTKALVPWTDNTPYVVPEGTRFISSSGIEFISTKSVTSRVLTKPWSAINNSQESLDNFYRSGGWTGIKYQKIPVIQGIQKTASIGQTSLKRFETFVLRKINVENASNSLSQKFFNVTLENNGKSETWVEIDSIYRAGPYDKVFEKKILKDGSGIAIKFGDGVSGMLPPNGYIVKVNYLETLGSAGNIDAKYQITSMIFPENYSQIDPRNGSNSKFLFCTNTTGIQGGKDIEDIENFRLHAPTSYLKSYTISNTDLYLDKILQYSPLSLLHCKVYPNKTITVRDTNGSLDNTIADEFNIISSNLQISAVLSNGTVLDEDEADEAFIKPLLLHLNGQISPNDTFTYIKPNLIQLAPSIKIRTKSLSLNDNDMKNMIKTAITSEYDIYNQDFNEPLYKSKIVELSSVFSWVESSEVQLEAMANVSFDSKEVKLHSSLAIPSTFNDILTAIPFEFDPIYVENKYTSGFKNYTVNSDYLLKIDLIFKNGKPTSKNRTFFLIDNRIESKENESLRASNTWLQDAKSMTIDNSKAPIAKKDVSFNEFNIKFFDEKDNNYDKRQVRVAQFDYIEKITDTKFMSIAKSRGTEPSENRPLAQDFSGNKKFKTEDVENDLREPLSEGSSIQGAVECYKKNRNYIDNVDIYFEENYYEIDSKSSGKGYLIIPLSYFGFDPSSLPLQDFGTENFSKVLEILLKEYVDIKVYAQPKSSIFEPKNQNDLCYIDFDNIKVEKETIYN